MPDGLVIDPLRGRTFWLAARTDSWNRPQKFHKRPMSDAVAKANSLFIREAEMNADEDMCFSRAMDFVCEAAAKAESVCAGKRHAAVCHSTHAR